MLRTRNTQVALKVEAVEGTKEALAAADAILAANAKFSPAVGMHKRDNYTGSLSPGPNQPGARNATISFDVELRGAAAAGTAPDYSAALRACGIAETIVALTSVTYKPTSATIPSATVAIYEDGKVKRIWGARGTATIKYQVGAPAVISFTFTGADWEVVDGALLAGVAYPSIVPPVFMGVVFSIGGYSAVINAMDHDFGNTVALRKSAAADSGHLSAMITGRASTLKIDPEEVLNATQDFFGIWRGGTLVALSASMGSAAGNRIAVSAPKVQYQSVEPGDRDGLSTLNINALLSRDAGDDEWQIQIT
jgi:hypothetical protein